MVNNYWCFVALYLMVSLQCNYSNCVYAAFYTVTCDCGIFQESQNWSNKYGSTISAFIYHSINVCLKPTSIRLHVKGKYKFSKQIGWYCFDSHFSEQGKKAMIITYLRDWEQVLMTRSPSSIDFPLNVEENSQTRKGTDASGDSNK